MIKEATASAFAFRHGEIGAWLLGLVWQPRLEGWLPAGGHVEPCESAAEAALRELREETGYQARLIPGPVLPLPRGFPHSPVPPPWWVVELAADPDGHTPDRHVHVDHVYLAVVPDDAQPGQAELPVCWFTEQELAETPGIGEDSRLQGMTLFGSLDGIITPGTPGTRGVGWDGGDAGTAAGVRPSGHGSMCSAGLPATGCAWSVALGR